MGQERLDLYTDYLLSTFEQGAAPGAQSGGERFNV